MFAAALFATTVITFMDSAAQPPLPADDSARRARAKERLYVIFQAGGWGFFWALQLLFVLGGFAPKSAAAWDAQLFQICTTSMVMAQGLLLSHYGRRLIERRGWKSLDWRALLPRVLALSAAQSVGWIVAGFAWPYLILNDPWTAKISIEATMMLNWINGTVSLAGWHGIYFFYHLFDRLHRSEIERLRLAGAVKEAELRALKSQVNPHFIFDSLNSLRALIDEDPARARQSVTQLANLLRYSLQSGQLETVPFEDALRVVNDYLALEQVRHEERLRLRIDIAPETLALPVPPMGLQTLVENAVKYGVSVRAEGGAALRERRELHARALRSRPSAAFSFAQCNGGTAGPKIFLPRESSSDHPSRLARPDRAVVQRWVARASEGRRQSRT